jgi:hypothetical protein
MRPMDFRGRFTAEIQPSRERFFRNFRTKNFCETFQRLAREQRRRDAPLRGANNWETRGCAIVKPRRRADENCSALYCCAPIAIIGL